MNLKASSLIRGCARPFVPAAQRSRQAIKAARKKIGAFIAFIAGWAIWPFVLALRALMKAPGYLWVGIVWLARSLLSCGLVVWRVRRPVTAIGLLAGGLAAVYAGWFLLPLKSPQELEYNKGALEIRKDIEAGRAWGSFGSDVQWLERSLLYYRLQENASIIDRVLYGRPNVEYAAQAFLKMGVIKLMSANSDKENIRVAREFLEKAVVLNPGIPYARDLLAGAGDINRLSIEALVSERNLELFFQQNQDSRSKKPDKGQKKKDGDKKNDKGNGDKKNEKEGDQKGEPDKPNDKPGKPDKKPNDHQPSPAQMNQYLYQNLQDVKNGTGNDGI